MFLGYSNWSNWAKGIRALANIELLVITLAFTSSNIIDNCVAPDIARSISFRNLEARLADNDADLSLVVYTFCETLVREYFVIMGNY